MDEQKNYLQKQIFVIGAGISGLACASRLIQFGFKNVVIIEAKDRIGGRVSTVIDSRVTNQGEASHFIELGAQWIHGITGNAIYDIAFSNGLVNESAPDYMNAFYSLKLISSEEELARVNALIQCLEEKLENIPENLEKNQSVFDYLSKEYQKFMEQHDKMSDVLQGAFDWYCKIQCEMSGCEQLSSVSISLLNQYKECEGLHAVELKHGYISVLKLVCDNIPENSILLNKEVKCIDWNGLKHFHLSEKFESFSFTSYCKNVKNMPKIKIICSDGELYEADHVICTFPLGYLKKHVQKLFVPSLPESKIKAIQAIGFGTVNKVFFEFLKPFWEPDAIYHVIWSFSLYEIFSQELFQVIAGQFNVPKTYAVAAHAQFLLAGCLGKWSDL